MFLAPSSRLIIILTVSSKTSLDSDRHGNPFSQIPKSNNPQFPPWTDRGSSTTGGTSTAAGRTWNRTVWLKCSSEESLLLFIPFVCKSWYRATKNPACWERIIFPDANDDVTDPFSLNDAVLDRPWTTANRTENQRFDVFIRTFARENDILWRHFSITNFMKMVIDRSGGSLRFLKIPGLLSHYMFAIHKTLQHVGKCCKNFAGMQLTNAAIGPSVVEAIVTFVPNLSFLSLRRSQIPRELMVMLLKEMKNLVLLDVRECVGFDQQDEEILRLASEIPTFLCQGARICSQEHLLRMWDGLLVHVIALD